MKELKVFAAFSGLGMQELGIHMSNVYDYDWVHSITSEVEPNVIIARACSNNFGNEIDEHEVDEITKELRPTQMAEYLRWLNIGLGEKDWFKYTNGKKLEYLKKLYVSCIATNNVGDINNCHIDERYDMLIYSFPCQNLSLAGKQEGFGTEVKRTRSGQLYQIERILSEIEDVKERPNTLLLENVAPLIGKFKPQFDDWCERLSQLGYNTYYQKINAKYCGNIPQNRERVFALSIRKDLDNGNFHFPQPFDDGMRLCDILDDKVDEKYYLSEKIQKRFKITDPTLQKNVIGDTMPDFRTIGERDAVYNVNGVMGALTATDYKQPKQVAEIHQIGTTKTGKEKWDNPQTERVYGVDGLAPTLNTCQGGRREAHIAEAIAMRGRYNADGTTSQHLEVGSDTANALTTVQKDSMVLESNYRIRKLTPRECWRLMGLTKEMCDKASAFGISDSSLYKIAGNGLCTNVVSLIIQHLYKAYHPNFVCDDEKFINSNAKVSA